MSPNGDIDCAIHLGNSIDDPVGVIFEVKKPTNVSEMITRDDLNRKALQELLLYYLRERHTKKNFQLKQLVVTNINEFFVFDAQEFERLFYSNKKLIKRFEEFNAGELTSEKTDFFYKEIAADFITQVLDQLTFTWFDLRKYKVHLDSDNNKRLIELFKFFSPEHLLKKRFQNDSNSLNTKFYSELLYIIGLEEVEEKDSHKRIITRRNKSERHQASILENALNILDNEDWIDNVEKRYSYGKTRDEQLFGIALALTINWVNRVLFLKLLEAQLVKYHKGDHNYAFMGPTVIPDYDELNKLFFQVLAKRISERSESINTKYAKVPYLNSSLFEINSLERQTIRISSLDNSELPLFAGTVLKEGNKPRYKQLPTLRYLLEFLDAYDFASEGFEEVQEQSKTLINASVLGLIFEKINGHKDGSVFTPGAITMYMSHEAIQQTVVRRFNEELNWNCHDYNALKNKDIDDIYQANAIIDSLHICDPAVGSGHFLVSVLNEIIRTKYDLGILVDSSGNRIKKQEYIINIENDELLVSYEDGNLFSYTPGNPESQRIQETLFNEKRKIIENCLFGVDLNPNAVNICRLRLWIELLKNAYYTKESGFTELETLPNIDINIKIGNSLLHRFDLNQDISEILRKNKISISEYYQAVNKYKNAHNKDEKRELVEYLKQIKGNLRTQIGLNDPKQVRKRLLGKELANLQAPQLFEISKKEQAERDKKAKDLQNKIDKLQKEIDEIQENKVFVDAFEWRIEFPEVLDENGKFIGFDCIIGNPPYIQLQKMGADADALQKMNYQTYERTGDIYCLFYEMGMALLKPNALLSFITSNKWMRAGYGESLRKYFSEKQDVIQLVDFAGYKIFSSATVDVNILTALKRSPQYKTQACSTNNKADFDITKLSDFVRQQNNTCDFKTADGWVILSPIEQSIKRKIEAVGTPLKDWDIQ
ncbi:MAG: Eco57I restriction-modification methylase domain-containing protein, partial [Bacteroidales bacterium]|nr:Eco57I restriction-modification methylase domain-containing protein [Bacteroidales bacterium]